MLDPHITPGQMLRLTVAANAIQVPGAPHALAGRLIEELGFAAIYISRQSIATSLLATGDECVLTLTELVQQLQFMTARTTVPVIVDAGDCFGDVANVRRAIAELERAGSAAIEIGDSCRFREGSKMLAVESMSDKIRSAIEARNDGQLIIIARTDARAMEGIDAAVHRARAYLKAGAEWILPAGLASREEFSAFAEAVFESPPSSEVRLVANMTEFGPGPLLTFDELVSLGFQIVLYPLTLLRVAMKAMESTLSILAVDGTQRDLVDLMQTKEELADLTADV